MGRGWPEQAGAPAGAGSPDKHAARSRSGTGADVGGGGGGGGRGAASPCKTLYFCKNLKSEATLLTLTTPRKPCLPARAGSRGRRAARWRSGTASGCWRARAPARAEHLAARDRLRVPGQELQHLLRRHALRTRLRTHHHTPVAFQARNCSTCLRRHAPARAPAHASCTISASGAKSPRPGPAALALGTHPAGACTHTMKPPALFKPQRIHNAPMEVNPGDRHLQCK